MWLYLTDIPQDATERWFILKKLGEYSLAISGKSIFGWLEDPDGVVYIELATYDHEGRKGTGFSRISPENSPLNHWVHIALQIKGKRAIHQSVFCDGMNGGEGVLESPHEFSNTTNPLFIGGCSDCKSVKGWIGELRISSGWRYKYNEPKIVSMPFELDEKTIALWHFDEPFGATSWEDSSGNGHTLFAEGTTTVDDKSKLVATWGKLKLTQ